MQRLEVSGAVRPLYGSLGVEGLIVDFKFWFHEYVSALVYCHQKVIIF